MLVILGVVLIVIGGIAMLYLDTFALTRAGIWTALTTKRHTRAVLSTLGQVMLFPWLAVLLLFFMASLSRGMSVGTIEFFVSFWFVIGIVVDLGVGIKSEWQLRNHFLAAAAGIHTRAMLAMDGLRSFAGEAVEA